MWADGAIIHSPFHFPSHFLSRQPSRFPAAPPADQHKSWSSGGHGSPSTRCQAKSAAGSFFACVTAVVG